MKKYKKYVIMFLVLVLGICSVYSYVAYKKASTKNAVEEYLVNDKNIERDNIEEIEPFLANLEGDKNWLVYVKIKGDDKKYYYYKDRKKNKVILESYILNGVEH